MSEADTAAGAEEPESFSISLSMAVACCPGCDEPALPGTCPKCGADETRISSLLAGILR